MFIPVFEGAHFSYFYENETGQYMLYWPEYNIGIALKGDDALLFKKQIELIRNGPEKDAKARIERAIRIRFYLKYSCPMPQFVET